MAWAETDVIEIRAEPRPLGSAEILDLSEEYRRASATHRALGLLAASLGEDPEVLTGLPIGSRDRLLITLRATCFGPSMDCLGTCPDCDETVEFSLDTADLIAGTNGAGDAFLDWQGQQIRLRPVTSQDLLALEASDPAEMMVQLLDRCADPVPTTLTDDAAAALSRALADLDPGADLQFSLTCPACTANWQSSFDIAGYLWSEIEMAARRLLLQVHALASAYGWTEAQILALSPTRRQSYLALLGAG